MPEDMSEYMPEDMPDRMSDRMPKDMPEHMPDRMPEDMSDRMPQDLPVRKCINVMVGITRSKVIIKTYFLCVCWIMLAMGWELLGVKVSATQPHTTKNVSYNF